MSLQKRLMKAGLMNKKDARKFNQKEKNKRKKDKGQRKKKRVLAEEEARSQALKDSEAQKEKSREKRERESENMRRARELQMKQLISHHAVRFREGKELYWHISANGRYLHQMKLPQSLVLDLQSERLCVAVRGSMDSEEPDYVLIPVDVANRIAEYYPERIMR